MVNELIASIIVAIVQGITEWLPVSSSGHIALFQELLGYEQGLLFDVALHFGTLAAVFVYFGKDIVEIIRDVITGKWKTDNGRLGILIIIATIPAAIIGVLFNDIFESAYTGLAIVAFGFAVTGIFLIIAGLSHEKKRKLGTTGAITIGIAQIFALFPGVSRSGSTIGTGFLLGLKERDAVKFSFLMSIPIIFGANIFVVGNNTLPPSLIWATLVSFATGLGTLHLLYGKHLVSRKNMKWFGLYALALAVAIAVVLIVN